MCTTQVFNAAEMRLKGTELEKFAKSKGRARGGGGNGRGGGGKARPRGFDDMNTITPVGGAGGAKSSKWRQQSKQFRDALRQVRFKWVVCFSCRFQMNVSLSFGKPARGRCQREVHSEIFPALWRTAGSGRFCGSVGKP